MAISNMHAVIFARFEAIAEFVNTKYARNERATLKELANKLKLPYKTIDTVLEHWLKYAVRHECPSNIIHKLSIFFTDRHERPPQFRDIGLSNVEKVRIFRTSKQWDMPGYTYIRLYKELMVATDIGTENVKSQLEDTWWSTNSCLQSMGLVDNAEDFKLDVDWGAYLSRVQSLSGGSKLRLQNDNIDIWMHWARKTIETHEKHKLIKTSDQEIICFAPTDETTEQRANRKEHCKKLNRFVEVMGVHGLKLTDVSTITAPGQDVPHSEWVRHPALTFTNPNDAMVDISVRFKTFGNIGKFILN